MNAEKLYLVKQTEEDGSSYWAQYDSLEDAVECEGPEPEVYVAVPEFLGKFKSEIKIVKIKNSKGRKK